MTDDFGSILDSTLALASCCVLSSSKLDLRFLVVAVAVADVGVFVVLAVDSGDLIDLVGQTGGADVAILRFDFSSIECRVPTMSAFALADLLGEGDDDDDDAEDDVEDDDDDAAIDCEAPLATVPDRLSAFWCRSFDKLFCCEKCYFRLIYLYSEIRKYFDSIFFTVVITHFVKKGENDCIKILSKRCEMPIGKWITFKCEFDNFYENYIALVLLNSVKIFKLCTKTLHLTAIPQK